MKNYIDEKIIVWQRHYFNDDANMQKIADEIQENDNCIYGIFEDSKEFARSEVLFETAETMSPRDNEGHATIEVNKDDVIIYKNNVDKSEEINRWFNGLPLDIIEKITGLKFHNNSEKIDFGYQEYIDARDKEWTKMNYSEKETLYNKFKSK